MSTGITPTTARRAATPSADPLPVLPATLAAWRWFSHMGTNEYGLRAPDGWQTKLYARPDRAISEAMRYLISHPQPDVENAPALPPGSSTRAIPLVELFSALEDHAAQVARPISGQTPFDRPSGLPERLDVPVGIVVPGRYQPRRHFDEGKLNDLADSIREHGILNPLIVFANEAGKLELIGGERRWRAAQIASLTMVPVEIRSYTLRQVDEISTIDNLQRDDLSALEEGAAYERMIREWQISEADLARRLSKNRGYIQQRRALASAAPEVQAAVENGTISFSQARAIAQAAPALPKVQLIALKAVQEQQQNGRRVDEAEAKRTAEKAVYAQVRKELTALGWKHETDREIMIWSDGEMPRTCTGPHVLDMITHGVRPGGLVPEVRAVTEREERVIYYVCGCYLSTQYAPWLSVRDHGKDRFIAPMDVPALAAECQQRWEAMQARYAAAGWTITHENGNSHQFRAVSSAGRVQMPWMWHNVVETITNIEAGKIAPEPLPETKRTTTPAPMFTCDRCKKKFPGQYHWIEDRHICDGCEPAQRADIAAAKARAAQIAVTTMQTWFDDAPIDVLRLLAASAGRSYNQPRREVEAQQLATSDRGPLITQILERIAREVYADRFCPVLASDEAAS